MSTKIDVTAINVLSELERIGWEWSAAGEGEIRCSCPVPTHKDDTPSVNLNTVKAVWQCHAAGCKASGDIVSFLAFALSSDRATILADLQNRYPTISLAKTIDPEAVERFHQCISEAGPLLTELSKRGVTHADIRSARLGFWKGRITIPVFDVNRNIINVRRYLPGAPGDKKMQNTPGYGKAAIYQIEQLLSYDKVWFCGGELKALVAGRLLNPHGVGAFAISAGEGTWRQEWNSLLKGKTVYICMDVDRSGEVAASELANQLLHACERALIIRLPLDTSKYPKGDINDYVGQENATAEDLLACMESAKPFEGFQRRQAVPTKEPRSVPINRVLHPSNVRTRVSFEGVIQGFFETPYLVPKTVKVYCDRSQPNCAICPIYASPITDEQCVVCEIDPASETLLHIVDAPSKVKVPVLKTALGIPACKSATLEVGEHSSVTEVRISPQVSVTSDVTGSETNIRVPAFLVDQRHTDANIPYRLVGVPYPHPKDQSGVVVVTSAQQIEDSLASFSPSKEDLQELIDVFAPDEWTVDGIHEALTRVYEDLAYNVTGIFGRLSMQTVLDLTWYSALFFQFEGRRIKGWVNSILVGDSGQGKTEMTSLLCQHYGAGVRVECKNASIAGLIGGLQQLGTRWFVTWGLIPQNDRRLVLLEEAKGLQPQDIGRMTDMRSSGIAELPKIEQGRANARTRLVFISNPREQRTIASFTYGVEAISQVVGALEDLRRFDVALVVSSDQVKAEDINKRRADRVATKHKATSALCRKSVLFAWTRTLDQIVFAEGVEDLIQTEALRLANTYSSTVPLIDRGTTREKLARLAVALAAKTCCYVDDSILVLPAHVEYVSRFLDTTYSDPVFGYRAFSEAISRMSAIADVEEVKALFASLPYPQDAVRTILRQSEFVLEDLQAALSQDRDQSMRALSLLVRKHCIVRVGRAYRKAEAFIPLLRGLLNNLPESNTTEDEF